MMNVIVGLLTHITTSTSISLKKVSHIFRVNYRLKYFITFQHQKKIPSQSPQKEENNFGRLIRTKK